MPPKRKAKKKKVKYYKKNFMLPDSSNKKLVMFCEKHNTTQNKVFRRALKEFLNRNVNLNEFHHHDVSPNQLSLF